MSSSRIRNPFPKHSEPPSVVQFDPDEHLAKVMSWYKEHSHTVYQQEAKRFHNSPIKEGPGWALCRRCNVRLERET